jgi:hypothetical protein
MMCNNDDAMMERWAPFSLGDKFDDANAEWMPTCVLALRGGRGGRRGGRDGNVFFVHANRAIGVTEFFWRHGVGGSIHNNSY